MNINTFRKSMEAAGDAVITYISPVSKKDKYVVATQEFDNTPHIKNKSKPEPSPGKELIYCWDIDAFKQIDPTTVKFIEPLNSIVNKPKYYGRT